jgi:hypothetical protein
MLKSESRKLHDELDFDALCRIFSAKRYNKDLYGTEVNSPHELYAVEKARDREGVRYESGIPVDVFVFGFGEPKEPGLTKAGGLPYWPAQRPWPRTTDGQPLDFLAQINFSDSKDLVGELPGQLLVVFTRPEECWFNEEGAVHFEWVKVRDQSLLTCEEYEPYRTEFTPCHALYGVIYRTFDYPASVPSEEEVNNGADIRLPLIHATKIGGCPFFIQPDERYNGKFLCQLASIQPACDVPFPWVNRKKQYRVEEWPPEITWCDMGSLYVFLLSDGSLEYRFDTF